MSENDNDYLQDAFRDQLIQTQAEDIFGIWPIYEQISRLRFYLQTLEEFIENQEKEEIEALKQRSNSLTQNQQAEFWAWNYPGHWDEVFRGMLRSSFIISLVSVLETRLSQACQAAAIIVRSQIKRSDLKGSVLERSRKFLEVLAKFSEPSPDQWDFLTGIYDVRNVLVHNQGKVYLSWKKQRLSKFIKAQPGLSAPNDFISIEKDFGFSCLGAIQSFLESLQNEIQNLCYRVQQFESK